MTLIGVQAGCGCYLSEKGWKSPKIANVNKNRQCQKFQDRALFGCIGQNRRMESFIIHISRSPCGGLALHNQKVPYLEIFNTEKQDSQRHLKQPNWNWKSLQISQISPKLIFLHELHLIYLFMHEFTKKTLKNLF